MIFTSSREVRKMVPDDIHDAYELVSRAIVSLNRAIVALEEWSDEYDVAELAAELRRIVRALRRVQLELSDVIDEAEGVYQE